MEPPSRPSLHRFRRHWVRHPRSGRGPWDQSLTFALADAVSSAAITGLDYSQAYVGYVFSRGSGDERFTFKQEDAAALPYKDQAFDAALSLLVLNSVPDSQRAAREMVRVTRPGGVVAAWVWDFRGSLTSLRVFADTAAMLDPDGDP